MTVYHCHPLAELMPATGNDEYRGIREDIRKNGQRVPVVLFEGKILDGRTRYRACEELGIPPCTTVFRGTSADARQLVVSYNFFRRHLSQSQKAIIAARLADEIVDADGVSTKEGQRQAAELMKVSPETTRKAAEIDAKRPKQAEKILNGKTTVDAEHKKMVVKRDPLARQRWKLGETIATIARLVESLREDDPCAVLSDAEALLQQARHLRSTWEQAAITVAEK
jgi:ParB-like chromosome segregation protein Spo0J